MRLPDHLSCTGIREWGMCHILFKQPDAVCVLVDGSQLLLSLQHMLLNGSSPPAVNWLGKFPAGYHDDGWHPRFALRQMEDIGRDSTLTFAAAAAMATPAGNSHGPQPSQHAIHLSANWSQASIPTNICSCWGIQVPNTGAACACISSTSKSLGFYISQSLRIHLPKKNKNIKMLQRTSSVLLPWLVAHSMVWSKHLNYSSHSKDSIFVMSVHITSIEL